MVEIISRQSVAIGCGLSCLIIFQSPVSAQVRPAHGHSATPTDQSRQIVSIDQVSLWDDAKIGRARAALSSLEVSRKRLVGLLRRLRTSEQSAANAENLGRSGEASYWRRDIAQIRPIIDGELKRAKPLAAEADVRCSGCTYSDLISKVRKAIDDAVALRSEAGTSSP